MTEPISIYDQVSFPSYPHAASHPTRLAAIARLRGLAAPDPERCHVLEIGCGVGGNLLPLAATFPTSRFLGIDLSEHQITLARQQATRCDLENTCFECTDVASFSAAAGEFDFIICHGVFSWTGDPARQKILELCRDHLSARGVAYINYNTYPGWHVQGMLRDMLQFDSPVSRDQKSRVAHARKKLRLFRETMMDSHFAGAMLARELETLERASDEYLFHAYLNVVNRPYYLHQVVEQAAAHGLAYLADAEPASTWPAVISPQVEAKLRDVASTASSHVVPIDEFQFDVTRQQYHDFVNFAVSRRSLFCQEGTELRMIPDWTSLVGLHVSAQIARVQFTDGPPPRLTCMTPQGQIAVSEPRLVYSLKHLADAWPESRTWPWLKDQVDEDLKRTGQSGSTADQWNREMLRCFAAGMIDLSVLAAPCCAAIGDLPRATRLARDQASRQGFVTNLRHKAVRLGDSERIVLQHLDGDKSVEQIANAMGIPNDAIRSSLAKLAASAMLLRHSHSG